MRPILTTLVLVTVLSIFFALMCLAHEPKKAVTRDKVSSRVYGWPHEWFAVTEDGRKEILIRRFAYSFGLVVVIPTLVGVTLAVLLKKPGRKLPGA